MHFVDVVYHDHTVGKPRCWNAIQGPAVEVPWFTLNQRRPKDDDWFKIDEAFDLATKLQSINVASHNGTA